MSSVGLNQKPSKMRYRASKMALFLCTRCWSGNKLEPSTWSMRRKLGESCLRNNIDPAVVSLDKSRTMSQGEGWGHCLFSTELLRTTRRLNVAAMSTARSVPSRPSIEKWMAVGWGTYLDVIVWLKSMTTQG